MSRLDDIGEKFITHGTVIAIVVGVSCLAGLAAYTATPPATRIINGTTEVRERWGCPWTNCDDNYEPWMLAACRRAGWKPAHPLRDNGTKGGQ